MSDNKDKRHIVFEKEDAYKNLEMTNSWISIMDTKASFLLAYVAVIIGFVFSNGIPHLFQNPESYEESFGFILKVICVASLYALVLLSAGLFFATLKARTKKTDNRHSLLFFGEIAKMSLNDYKAKILNRTEEEFIKDVLDQIHMNSTICKRKSQLFNCGVITTIIATLLFVICVLLQLL